MTHPHITNIVTYRANVPDSPPWVTEPITFYGGVTLLAGRPKGGKSTLLSELQSSRETGRRFLGVWPCLRGPTLLITEESGVAVVMKTRGLVELDVLDRFTAARAKLEWEDVLDLAYAWSRDHEEGLIVIDTLASWSGAQDENDAAEMTDRIGEVMTLAASGPAVILVHHTRKGGGDLGEGIRGSSAIMGTVDVVAEFGNRTASLTDTRRVLSLQGRVIHPQRYLLDYVDGQYVMLDWDEDGREGQEDLSRLAAIFDQPLSMVDVAAKWGCASSTARKRRDELVDAGLIRAVKKAGAKALYYERTPDEPAEPADPADEQLPGR